MRGVATTTRGLEEVAISEITEIVGKNARKAHPGLVTFDCTELDLFMLNFLARSLHRIIMLLIEESFSDAEDIYRKVKEVDFSGYIDENQSFAVRAKRCGTHDFTSMDVASWVGQAVIDSFMEATGKRLTVNLDEPDVIVRVEVRDKMFWLGIDTTGEVSLAKRGYRCFRHPAPLKPTIAYSLVRLSGWHFEESLIDPVCGTGTIPIEAGRYACDLPNTRDVSIYHLPFFMQENFLDIRREHQVINRKLDVLGSDINEKFIQGAKKCARLAGVDVRFMRADAREIPLDYDVIIANPPYGIRMGSPRKLERFYEAFATNLRRYEGSWRCAVIFTARPSSFVRHMGEPERELDVLYGNLPSKVLIYR